MLLQKPKETVDNDDQCNSDEESPVTKEISVSSLRDISGNASEEGRIRPQISNENGSEKGNQSKANSVCGVPLCREERVIVEPNLAFTWFKDRYPGAAMIDKKKNILKSKISEAKDAGKRIEEIRFRICQHKDAIDKARTSHVLTMVSGREENMSQCVEEKMHSDAINFEKAAYNETLDRLGELKTSIENIQKLVENKRQKLQADFDTWYRQVCYEENRSNDDTGVRLRTAANEDKSNEMIRDIRKPSLPIEAGRERVSSKPEDGTLPIAESQNEFRLPQGVKLTGNHQVDDDIIAFYKAKEALISKCKR